MKSFKFYFLLFLATLFIRCIDPYELNYRDIPLSINVDAEFSSKNKLHVISLNQSGSIGSQNFTPVDQAKVKLIRDDNQTIELTNFTAGKYRFEGQLDSTRAYRLEIVLLNNQKITSEFQSFPKPISVDSIDFETEFTRFQNPNGTVFQDYLVHFNSHLNPQKNTVDGPRHIRFDLETVFVVLEFMCSPFHSPKPCYVYNHRSNYEIQLLDLPKNSPSTKIQQRVFTKIQDYEMAGTFSLKVTAKSYNKDIFDYWQKLKVLNEQRGSITDQIPSRVKSPNLSITLGDVTGHFALYKETEAYSFIRRGEAGGDNGEPFCGTPGNWIPWPWPNECCECLLFPNSSKDKPYYWQ
jgi:hypothetical protein